MDTAFNITNIINTFKSTAVDAAQSVVNYEGSFQNAIDKTKLYNQNAETITGLQNKLLDTRQDYSTNDRKSYYETQAIQNLKYWYTLFNILFKFLAVGLVISLFVTPNSLSLPIKIVIIAALALYNYYILYIAKYAMKLYTVVTDLLPKNMYTNI
jgi:hypothetical protein